MLSGRGIAAEPDAKALELFEKKIRPVLVEKCYSCHSAEAAKNKKLKGGLQLDTRQGLLTGGETGPAIVPGKPAEGTLLNALRYTTDLKMPPTTKLADSVVADFEAWIKAGAVDPRDGKTSTTTAGIDWESARKHWAFQSPKKYPAPAVKQIGWGQNGIDAFVLAALEKRGIQPAKPADKRTWLRRASFDLIGLPPTSEELEAFLADESPNAFATVLDRLLASPHYGERWGRYWLDVSRYAEDKALAFPTPRPHAYQYRDWVVQAFNSDMPYDRFLRLQLAGDMVKEPVDDYFLKLAGLGFQGLGAEYHKGSVAEQVKADELDDRIDTLSRGLLGLTVACARCHDHKFDPIPTRDYYSLAAAYKGSDLNELFLAPNDVVEIRRKWEAKLKELEAAANQYLVDQGRVLGKTALVDVRKYLLVAWQLVASKKHKVEVNTAEIIKRERLDPYFVTRWTKIIEVSTKAKPALPALKNWLTIAREAVDSAKPTANSIEVPESLQKATDQLAEELRDALAVHDMAGGKEKKPALTPRQDELLKAIWLGGGNTPFAPPANEALALLPEAAKKQHASLLDTVAKHKQAEIPQLPKAHGISGGGQAMKINVRGKVDSLGEPAPPGFLRILDSQISKPSEKPAFTRLDLADAVCSADNPLTARVMVNRIWQHHFGRGIVGTPSNFGLSGEAPTHPKLLDTLAVRFVETGWSIKWLHREIMLSATYQQSSQHSPTSAEIDPENHYLWRFAPHRLDVEAWRDAILSASGRLDAKLAGPSLSLLEATHVRRTIYSRISRIDPDKLLVMFDFPDANVSSEKRGATTIPQQQLFVLNSDFMLRSAKAFSVIIEKSSTKDEDRVALAYRLAFGRVPTVRERSIGLAFLSSDREKKAGSPSALEQFAQALLASNEFTWVD